MEAECIRLFAAFPRERDRNLFRSVLENEKSTKLKWTAALGLANLCDTSSVDLIIEAMQKDSCESNRRFYLEALAKIKGGKAKEAVKSYRKSGDEYIRKVVAKLLRKW